MHLGLLWENILRLLVLVLTRIELIFFAVPGTLLCFELRMITLWITHWYFSCCWGGLHRTKGFSTPHPTKNEAGHAQAAVRGHSRNSWPQLIQGISQTTQSPAQHLNQWNVGQGLLLRKRLGISQSLVSNCFSFVSLIFLGVYFSFLLFSF